jgi:hypothetical protein
MLATFRSPEETGQIIVSLPEEMPLQESLEMRDFLLKLFPRNAPAMVVNRCFPQIEDLSDSDFPRTPHSPLAASAWEYAERRSRLERVNLQLWERSKIQPDRLDYEADSEIVESLSRQLEERYLS